MKVKALEFGHPSQRKTIRGKHGINAGRAIILAQSVVEGSELSVCIDLIQKGKVSGALKDAFTKEVKSRVSAFSKEHPDYVYSRAGRKEAVAKAKPKAATKTSPKAPKGKVKPKTAKKKAA
jgi:5-deoxy-D-glucuronate isomerase